MDNIQAVSNQLSELINQKNALASNLNEMGVEASSSEKLNTLVPKVLDILKPSGTIEITENGGYDVAEYKEANVNVVSKLPQVVDKSVITITADDLAGATSIGNSAFSACRNLTSVSLPSTLTSIDGSAFSNCSSLTSITIPEGVTSIGDSAFSNCSSLTSITIPEGVTSIGNSTFYHCGLTSITIPEGVIMIGIRAFQSCYGLTSITIPASVFSIGNNAFWDCSNLTTMRVEATTPPTLGNTRAISTATTQIQVPMASVEAYKTATNWSNFADIIVGY